jgi:hypothetical protein
MTERYVIEIGGEHYGLLVQENRHFVFHATHPAVVQLDRSIFKTLRAAVHAVKQAVAVRAA